MWWNGYWPMGSGFFFLPMLVCMGLVMAGMYLLMRSGRLCRCGVSATHGGLIPPEHERRTTFPGTPDAGSTAFEEYREETLRRLDREQQEFQAFIGHLREARDKAEFDRFMAERTA